MAHHLKQEKAGPDLSSHLVSAVCRVTCPRIRPVRLPRLRHSPSRRLPPQLRLQDRIRQAYDSRDRVNGTIRCS